MPGSKDHMNLSLLISLVKRIRWSHVMWIVDLFRWLMPKRAAKAKRPPRPVPPDYFTHAELRIINFLADDYKWAAKLVGIPWMLLPVTHKIERHFKTSPATGGWAQLDMGGKNPDEKAAQRKALVVKVMKKYGVTEYGPLRSDFRTGCIMCAHILKGKVPRRLRDKPWTDEKVAEASFGYNGRARYYNQHWQTGSGSKVREWRWSPYVANWLAGRKLFVKGRQYHKGKRVAISKRIYKNPGTLLLYRELRRRAKELA